MNPELTRFIGLESSPPRTIILLPVQVAEWFRRCVGALFVVIGGIAGSELLGLGARGVKMLGDLPEGLPPVKGEDADYVTVGKVGDRLTIMSYTHVEEAVDDAHAGRVAAVAVVGHVGCQRHDHRSRGAVLRLLQKVRSRQLHLRCDGLDVELAPGRSQAVDVRG